MAAEPNPRFKPAALQPGDTIGVVAPASPFKRETFDRSCENLRRQGQEKYAVGAYLACVSFADAMIAMGAEFDKQKVMNQLRQWDEVAFVRFASVYRHFTDATDFMDEIRQLLESRKKEEK